MNSLIFISSCQSAHNVFILNLYGIFARPDFYFCLVFSEATRKLVGLRCYWVNKDKDCQGPFSDRKVVCVNNKCVCKDGLSPTTDLHTCYCRISRGYVSSSSMNLNETEITAGGPSSGLITTTQYPLNADASQDASIKTNNAALDDSISSADFVYLQSDPIELFANYSYYHLCQPGDVTFTWKDSS